MIDPLTPQEKLWIAQRLYSRARDKAKSLLKLERKGRGGATTLARVMREDIAECNRLAMKLSEEGDS